MYTNLLLNGLKGKDRTVAEEEILRAQPFLKRVEEKIKEELSKDMSTDFDSPSWAYKNAYELGYRCGLTKLLKYGNLHTSKE